MVLLLYLQEPQEVVVSKVTLGLKGGAGIGRPYEKSTQNNTFGGYDCDFVEPPPSELQTECPICHLNLREPYQITCCGTSFCYTCIQRLQADNSHCPTCRKGNYKLFRDKGLNRSLKQLQVFCAHKQDGCQWSGELGALDQHLSVSQECSLTIVDNEVVITKLIP